MNAKICLAAALFVGAISTAAAQEIVIYTGGAPTGEGSTYHNGMGKAVEEQLERLARDYGYDVRRIPSGGAVANANACAEEKENLCFGIGQGGIEYEAVASGATQILRSDLPGECAMAFTAEPRLPNWRAVMDNARRVTFIVPEGSGSEAFIRKVFEAEPSLAGTEPNFSYARGQDNILSAVSTTRGGVGVFYAYPNPTDGMVNAAANRDLSVMGILSPAVAQTSDAFYLNRKAPYELTFFGLGTTKTVRAMCSKALLFAGQPSALDDTWAQGDYEDLITAIKALPADAFVPEDGPLASLMREVEGLSEEFGVSEMVADLNQQVTERLQ